MGFEPYMLIWHKDLFSPFVADGLTDLCLLGQSHFVDALKGKGLVLIELL